MIHWHHAYFINMDDCIKEFTLFNSSTRIALHYFLGILHYFTFKIIMAISLMISMELYNRISNYCVRQHYLNNSWKLESWGDCRPHCLMQWQPSRVWSFGLGESIAFLPHLGRPFHQNIPLYIITQTIRKDNFEFLIFSHFIDIFIDIKIQILITYPSVT